MQPGFDRADRNAGKFLNFCEFIAFRVVQEHHDPVLFTELLQSRIELFQLLHTLIFSDRIIAPWQAGNALARQVPLFNNEHALPRKASVLVDEQVVHDTGQPGAGLFNIDKIIEFAKCLDQQLLKKIFCLGLVARKAIRKSIQAVEVRPHELIE